MTVALAHMYTLHRLRGIERYVLSLANALARRGTAVVLVTGRTASPCTAERLDPRVAVHAVRHWGWRRASFLPGFLADFLRYRYDALSLFLPWAEGRAAAIAGRLRPLPFNLVFQYPASGHERLYRSFGRLGLPRRARALIAVSRYVARDVERWFGRPAAVIPSGVDAARFRFDPEARRAVRAELGLEDGEPLLLSVCAIEGRKGLAQVLAALPRLAARRGGPPPRYVVVGDGPPAQRAAFEATVRTLGLERVVRVTGYQPAPERYYSAADAFVLLSRDEAFGLVVLEALACGLPVVVSDGSAFPEIVPPGAGHLVPPDDPDAVADALGRALAAGRPGEAARAPVVARYSWDRVADAYLAAVAGAG
ncbi:MAG TPA: glycosyltransferase family 1 protein [Thermodesulfobacteriota bacterium]|nr:glycosyltransferase family 1 protein [Thermodesulfobacteriota bacterium]